MPEELIDAARRRRLVLFVGAGVSVNPPSNLPLFGSLARRVAEQLGVDHADPELPSVDDFPDQFLGQLANEQPSVKEQARAIIDAPGSKPNPTHHVIARLAAASGAPIVSTNYDEHIETAAAASGRVLGDRFNAPALPLGRDFNGIVYLHGAVTRPAAELVVTDEDFGRAYLTDGWARRFVQELFLNWTVLFVGYSHSDFVMRYLARGLPPNTIRFALTDKPDSKHWGALGIRPVPYDNHEHHAELSAALESWAKLLEMGHLDEHVRAREIATGAPPKAPDEADFLAFAVTNPTGARGFALAADGYEWLRWAEEQEVFRALFLAGRCENEASIVLAEWFVERYIKDPEMSALALGTIARLGPVVCDQLLFKIALAAEDLAQTSPPESTRWSALVTAGLRTDDGDPERMWHNPYRESLTTNNRLSLLRRALRARIVLSERRPWFGEEEESAEPLGVTAEVAWSCSNVDLAALWEPLRGRLPANAIEILQIAEQGLLDAYQLLRAVEPDTTWDSWSYGRSAIEPHEQDHHDTDETPIIDALRDSGTIVAATDRSLAKRWVAQEFALFRRLGLHLLIEDTSITTREKLDLLLAGAFLYDDETKHEVFRLVQTLSPQMDASERADLLPRILDGPPPFGLSEDEELRLHDRCIFDRLEWIQRIVKDWPELDAALDEILQRHPDMGVRPHPDMDHWMESGTWGGVPPFEVDEFIELVDSEGPHAAVARLLARDYSERIFGEPTWDDATSLIRNAVAQAPRLGVPLLIEVLPSPVSRHDDLMAAIIYGWAAAILSDEEVSTVLEEIDGFTGWPKLTRAISQFCKSVVDQRAEVRPESLLSRVDELARRIWDTHAEEYEAGGWSDPVTHGLNTWPGFIAQYWLYRISLRWRAEAESWTGLSEVERDALREILESRAAAGVPALGILATDLYFLFAADRQFTIDTVFSVFDLERSTHPAAAWKSYLHSPRRSADMLDSGFWRLLQDARHLIDTVDSALQQQYWDVLASVAAFSEADSVNGTELVHSLASQQVSNRLVPFLRALGRAMSLSDDEAREHAWSAWIRDTMHERTHAVAGVQPTSERSAWADLALEMGTFVPEALRIVDEAPAPFTDRTRFDQLPESLLQSSSDLIAETTYHRLLAMDEADWHAHFQLEKLVARLKPYASMQSLRAVTERSITLGIAGAINWLN